VALLSRKTDYALLILLHLHHKREGASAREIADRHHLSRAFVANILKDLCQKGYVASHRGVKGGYVLARPVEDVTLVELIESLDDPFRFAECNQLVPDDGCSIFQTCPLKGPVAEVHQRIREVLRTLTLADVFRPARRDGAALPGGELLSLSVPEPFAAPVTP
jgi:Rrf2 family cysteine metabolism transcriptional repressor